jgi:hypothetical protein
MPKTPGFTLGDTVADVKPISGPHQDAADIVHWLITFTGAPVDMEIEPTFEVRIHEVEIEDGKQVSLPAIDTLRDIRDAVNAAIGKLEGFVE